MTQTEQDNVRNNLRRQYDYLVIHPNDKHTLYNIQYIKDYMRKHKIEEKRYD